MVYAFFTSGQRTWGGPRADAGQADAVTSPQAAIEYAEATGDDLNIVPESFRPAVEARAQSISSRLRPNRSWRTDSRLTQSAPRMGMARDAVEGLIGPTKATLIKSATVPHMPLHPRPSMSMESITSAMSEAAGDLRRARSPAGVPASDHHKPSPKSHPPIARSARFENRRSRRDPDTTASSRDSYDPDQITPAGHNKALIYVALKGLDPDSASAAGRIAAWQSLTLPQISPVLSSEERLLILPEGLPPSPNHRGDESEDVVLSTSGHAHGDTAPAARVPVAREGFHGQHS